MKMFTHSAKRLGLCALVLLGARNGTAATLTVTNQADNVPGTLRQLIADASPGDSIAFAINGRQRM